MQSSGGESWRLPLRRRHAASHDLHKRVPSVLGDGILETCCSAEQPMYKLIHLHLRCSGLQRRELISLFTGVSPVVAVELSVRLRTARSADRIFWQENNMLEQNFWSSLRGAVLDVQSFSIRRDIFCARTRVGGLSWWNDGSRHQHLLLLVYQGV